MVSWVLSSPIMTVGRVELASKEVSVSKRQRCEVIVCDAPLSHTARMGDEGSRIGGGVDSSLGRGGGNGNILVCGLNVVSGEK